jgi:hypothetical protein
LSATSAMNVPRQIMTAAKIIMLRITPHSIRKPCGYHHAGKKISTDDAGRQLPFWRKG